MIDLECAGALEAEALSFFFSSFSSCSKQTNKQAGKQTS